MYDVGVLAIQILIASGAALQAPSFKFSDPLSENPGSAPMWVFMTIFVEWTEWKIAR